MKLWDVLLRELVASKSALPVSAVFVTAALVRLWAPDERRRLRGGVVLTVCHLGLIALAALLASTGAVSAARATVLVARLTAVAALVALGGVALFAVLLGRLGVAPPRIVQDTVMAIAGVSAGLLVTAASGYNLSGVIATSAVLTAVIGFSLQDTLGNIIGGLALQLDHSIAVGHWVVVGGSRAASRRSVGATRP